MDRSYKEDIPRTKETLEELKKEFSGVASPTDWTKLRIEPLLDHVKSLERLLRSPKFARETARLRRGVAMFHSDLVYLRENVKALKKPSRLKEGLAGTGRGCERRGESHAAAVGHNWLTLSRARHRARLRLFSVR
jgi:hypothetical protein